MPAFSSYIPMATHRVTPIPGLSGNHIDKHDAGLKGTQGADIIIKLLRANRSVKHLILGHNELGDDGCVLLFEYLRSETGRRHQVAEISLNANKIGDAGLWAIARYLEGNTTLGALFLQNNAFQGDCPIILRFALSVNRSHLHTLSLTCNPPLAEALVSTFLPNLNTPCLSELHLSVCSLGPSSTSSLLSYLTSSRSHSLHMLKINGNPLGIAAAAQIVNTLERANWSIGWLEIHACASHDGPADDNSWNTIETQLRIKVLERNRFLRHKVEQEALVLLPCARALLLTSAHARTISTTGFRARIPNELLFHILSFIAPSLSTAQLLRVCTYASTIQTLPSVGLNLPYPAVPSLSRFISPHTCVMDQWGFPVDASLSCAGCVRTRRAMSPLREQGRKAWLRRVGCDRFEAVADLMEVESLKMDVDESTG